MAMYANLLPLDVRTQGVDSKPVTVWEKFTAAHVVIDHPNIGGGITVSIMGYDANSGYKYTLLSTAIVASGHTVMKIGPDYTAAANIAKDYIPYQIVASVTASGTNAYGISASII